MHFLFEAFLAVSIVSGFVLVAAIVADRDLWTS